MQEETSRKVSACFDGAHSRHNRLRAPHRAVNELAMTSRVLSRDPFLVITSDVNRTVECLAPFQVRGVIVRMRYLSFC